MRARTAAVLLLELVLGCAVVGVAMDVVDHFRGARLEVGRVRLGQLEDATRSYLGGLRDRVFLTYYVSPSEAMPSHLRRLERQVTDLLEAMKGASDGMLDYQLIDPTADPELASYAAKRKVAPVRVRHVTRDAYSEQEIWSTLTMAHGPGDPAVIPGLVNEHLPRLQSLMVAQLRAMEAPRAPVFALAAREGAEAFGDWLAERGQLFEVDIAAGEPIPEAADIVFWMDPAPVDAARLDELDALLDTGRSVVIAGGQHRAQSAELGGLPAMAMQPTGYRGDALWAHYGLGLFGGLVFDERCQVLGDPGQPAPYRVTCIANNQDFHSLVSEVNGNLVFELPNPFLLDGEALAAGGWTPEVLGSSSELTWTQESESDVIALALMVPEAGESLPKQPLMVWLRPEDPWRGSLMGFASSSPFRDGLFDAPGTAHERLAAVITQTLASPDRLVLNRAEIPGAESVPALGPGARAGWRLFCVGLAPVLLGLVALWRGRGVPLVRRAASGGWWRGLLLRGLAGAVVVGLVASVATAVGDGGRLDLTEAGLNGLHPTTRRLVAGTATAPGTASAAAPITAELFLSDSSRLAPEMRRPAQRLVEMLRELSAAAGADGFDLQRIHPEDLGDDARAALEVDGIAPVRVTSRRDEVTEVRTAWSCLRLSSVDGTASGDRSVLLQFPDVASHESAEFRLGMALHELRTGRRPHVAFASDTPRLSAAERHRYYQSLGLIPPLGKDEYSEARALLEQAGFRVSHVDPGRGRLPDDIDVLVWLQPRRPMERMLESTVGYLYRGGNVLLAAQHFNIQPQQFRGANFDFVYWPRPQTTDLETLYFPELGIQLVREVLFDTESLPVDLESQVNATERRDFKSMRSALPFLVRAAASRFAPDSPLTAGLGDQAFIWASFLEWDAERLKQLGLSAKMLMTTSPEAWTMDWSGGFLPDEVLAGPPDADATDTTDTTDPIRRGPLPLAALFEGNFPWPRNAFHRSSADAEPEPYLKPEPGEEHAPGRLLFLGCSELFKDARLAELAPDYRGDQLLLDLVAGLALDEELAAVVARRPVVRGFGRLPGDSRMRWRSAVVLGAPALYLLLGLLRFAQRRRGLA